VVYGAGLALLRYSGAVCVGERASHPWLRPHPATGIGSKAFI